jgi:dihydrofolate reductase
VADLKRQPGPDLGILGSGELIQSLRRRSLIDEYVLLVFPLVLGSGRRLFPDGSATTTTGVVIASYEPVTGTGGEAA